MSEAPETTFTAVAQIVIDGVRYASDPIPFGPAGVTLIAQVLPGTKAFKVLAGPPRTTGYARFEKTCFELVTFNIDRDGEPLQDVLMPTLAAVDMDLRP